MIRPAAFKVLDAHGQEFITVDQAKAQQYFVDHRCVAIIELFEPSQVVQLWPIDLAPPSAHDLFGVKERRRKR